MERSGEFSEDYDTGKSAFSGGEDLDSEFRSYGGGQGHYQTGGHHFGGGDVSVGHFGVHHSTPGHFGGGQMSSVGGSLGDYSSKNGGGISSGSLSLDSFLKEHGLGHVVATGEFFLCF